MAVRARGRSQGTESAAPWWLSGAQRRSDGRGGVRGRAPGSLESPAAGVDAPPLCVWGDPLRSSPPRGVPVRCAPRTALGARSRPRTPGRRPLRSRPGAARPRPTALPAGSAGAPGGVRPAVSGAARHGMPRNPRGDGKAARCRASGGTDSRRRRLGDPDWWKLSAGERGKPRNLFPSEGERVECRRGRCGPSPGAWTGGMMRPMLPKAG